jgi:outer membrane protein with beta-barrel domain
MNKYLFIALAMALGLSARAQISFQKVIKVGVKAGITGSVFTRDVEPFDPHISGYYDTFENFVRVAGYGGLTLDYDIGPRLSIGAEVLYSAKGMSYREDNDDVVIIGDDGEEQAYNYFNFNVDYIELPVTLNFNVLPLDSKTWLKVYGGIARAAAVHKKTKLKYPDVRGYDAPDDVKEELQHVRTFNTSVIGGLKVGGKKDKRIIPFGDLRGSYMLSPVFNRSKAANGGNLDTRMFSLSLGLGLQF